MGYSDEIFLSDAHFPANPFNSYILCLEGVYIPELLLGIFPHFELDSYNPVPLIMMAADTT